MLRLPREDLPICARAEAWEGRTEDEGDGLEQCEHCDERHEPEDLTVITCADLAIPSEARLCGRDGE